MLSKGPDELGKFCEKICHQFPDFVKAYQTSETPSLASEQDKFLSGVKSDRFVNLHAMIWLYFWSEYFNPKPAEIVS